MQQITQPIAQVIWYASALSLGVAPWKANTNIVRTINPQGTGYISFTPGANINALTSVATGQVLIVESTSTSYTAGYGLDNGTPPTATTTPNPVRLIASFPAGGTSPAPLTITLSDQVGTYNLDASFPATGVTGVTYTKSGAGVVTLPVALALGDTLSISGTTVAGTPGILTLLKQ